MVFFVSYWCHIRSELICIDVEMYAIELLICIKQNSPFTELGMQFSWHTIMSMCIVTRLGNWFQFDDRGAVKQPL